MLIGRGVLRRAHARPCHVQWRQCSQQLTSEDRCRCRRWHMSRFAGEFGLTPEARQEREAETMADMLACARDEAALAWRGQSEGLRASQQLRTSGDPVRAGRNRTAPGAVVWIVAGACLRLGGAMSTDRAAEAACQRLPGMHGARDGRPSRATTITRSRCRELPPRQSTNRDGLTQRPVCRSRRARRRLGTSPDSTWHLGTMYLGTIVRSPFLSLDDFVPPKVHRPPKAPAFPHTRGWGLFPSS
jgi:hypothetical protein